AAPKATMVVGAGRRPGKLFAIVAAASAAMVAAGEGLSAVGVTMRISIPFHLAAVGLNLSACATARHESPANLGKSLLREGPRASAIGCAARRVCGTDLRPSHLNAMLVY